MGVKTMTIFELIQELAPINCASGSEAAITAKITELCKPYTEDITKTAMGNLVVHKPGNGKKVMLMAHCDTIGFIVTHYEENGVLRLGVLGGQKLSTLPGTPVVFANGVRGVIGCDEKVDAKDVAVFNLYIDIGASSEAEAKQMVRRGDTAVLAGDTFAVGDKVFSPALNNRLGCAVLIDVLQKCKSDNDLYFVFTVQHEIGVRGAGSAAYGIDPEIAIAVEVTDSGDLPDPAFKTDVKMGGGAVIRVCNGVTISNPKLLNYLEFHAHDKVQRDVRSGGLTDLTAVQSIRGGIYAASAGVAIRHRNTAAQIASLSDTEKLSKMLVNAVNSDMRI